MIKSTHYRRNIRASLFAGLVVLCLSSAGPLSATAQVMEIDDTGGVTVHDRPEVTLTTGVTPIQKPRPASPVKQSHLSLADLADAARNAELSADLVEAVAWRESGVRPGLVSSVGAIGEMQLMPSTARDLGVDPYDTRQNFRGGATYLAALLKRYDGDMVKALAAYNAGPRAVDRYGGVPPYKETEAYVAAILNRLSQRTTAAPER